MRKFRELLPASWVCRDKSHDYGVDQEVEIFEADGSATGLTLNVQLKATDSAAEERYVSVKTDRLRYMESLPAHGVIVRYCDATGALFWLWSFRALVQSKAGAESVQVTYADENLWRATTASEIVGALRIFRILSAPNRLTRFPLNPIFETSPGNVLIAQQALREICALLPFADSADTRPLRVPISVIFRTGEILLVIDHVGQLQFDVESYSRETICDLLIYGLVSFCSQNAFTEQARLAAQVCLSRGRPSQSKESGALAAKALLENPEEAANLAIINGIHITQDFFFSDFVMNLTMNDSDAVKKGNGVQKFYTEAIKSSGSRNNNSAVLHYSLGNSLSQFGNYVAAIRAFNSARRCDPKYESRSYFLNELGAAFFLIGRFRCAASAYQLALNLEPK